MKKYLLFICCFVLTIHYVYGQGENNIWTFGRNYSLDFNTSPPTLKDTVFLNGESIYDNSSMVFSGPYHRSVAVCDDGGALLFIVKMGDGGYFNPNIVNIYDKNESPILGTGLLTNLQISGGPIVVPHPGNANQYYIFYVRDKGLIYSLFDMNLNNGLGGIVPGHKNMHLTGFGKVNGERMTTIAGCNGVWFLVRSFVANEYLSFHITNSGIDTMPVVSECGLFPILNYAGGGGIGTNGVLKASPDGTMLATGLLKSGSYSTIDFEGGLELYDFEKCSGRISNARLLAHNIWVSGVCFSPNSKLLYSTEDTLLFNGGGGDVFLGKVFQYDLTQPTLNDIVASKALILTNPTAIWAKPFCPVVTCLLGDMKIGPDGKIYLLNNHPLVCAGTGMAFHLINLPNNVGMACSPQINAIYNFMNGMGSNTHDIVFLPKEIVKAPLLPDTIAGNSYIVNACFADSLQLMAEDNRHCYLWDNGSTKQERTVYEAGKYWVGYFQDCSFATDTFIVAFHTLPKIPVLTYGCPGNIILKVNGIGNALYKYSLINEAGDTVEKADNIHDWEVSVQEEGNYFVNVKDEQGCDTTVAITLMAYPAPQVNVQPEDTTIKYGDAIQLEASGAERYYWYPKEIVDESTFANPIVRPVEPIILTLIGKNEYGCTDTGHVNLHIDYFFPELVPNAFSPNRDGLNDMFRMEGLEYQQVEDFSIFNRYGQRVFYTIDISKGWDGTFNGAPCDAGTYFYRIKLHYPNKVVKTYKGEINLIR